VFDNIAQSASRLNINLPPNAKAAFEAYYSLLEKHNENVNLTAISGESQVSQLHFNDSLALLTATSFKNAKVIDIGSGAGFPGVPIKIAEPSIDLTLLDATRKRIDFLKTLCKALGINATCLHFRAEEAAHNSDLREKYDICVSRAVAKLNILCELCLPYVRVGGLFIAMKSTASGEELEDAKNAVLTTGGELQKLVDYTIADTDIVHRLVLIQKISKTSDKYPRRFARIQKSPL